MAGKKKTISYEDALAELEKLLDVLEQDDLTLDRALSIFERGIGLMRICDGHLKGAQGKIKELLRGENGEFIENELGVSLESFIGGETIDE